MHFLTKTILSVILLTLCLWAANKASANRIANSDIAKQLPTIITQNERPFTGIIMVKRDNQPLFTYISGDNVSLKSEFIIASLSKQVTATLVLKAVDDGKLALDQSVNHYLGSQPSQKGPDNIPDSVTISHLLSNTSGLVEAGKPPLFEPGSQFKYSNYGYALLGQLLETVNQQPITEQINAFNLQAGLGGLSAHLGKTSTIKKTSPLLLLGQEETRHQQQDGNDTSSYAASDVEINQQLLTAGGMMASADAYSHFQYALFTGQLISEQSLLEMTTSHSTREHRWGALGYGYGTQISNINGITEYSHSGYLPGYVSLALYYPQSNVNVVILENTSWDLQDINRTFGLHDKIRNSINSKLVALEDRPVAKLYQAGKEAITATLLAAK
ncbi:serine hydrolase [Shewanella sp. Choline-02u-19]|uniref:serine hydrolase domain-containing protein n=1 Tax=unclassified Shewanella TaxID=196818 RepID=UPI000C32AA52|nr:MULTISPECIES: serine hydrolase domain-containing protein [unclassified Shewanella]PKH54461.1 serine hydrolase [Shewanella sp. Bg11-22]PKI28518.1 serine hydrolase [Shewanella sp. Choline-02u-19]